MIHLISSVLMIWTFSPKGAIKSMIEPIDDYIDLSKPLLDRHKGCDRSVYAWRQALCERYQNRPCICFCIQQADQWKITAMTILLSFMLMTSGHGASSQRCALTLQTLKLTDMLLMVTGTARLLTILAVIHLSVLRTASL